MMNDDDGALEGVPDRIRGLYIGGHVSVIGLGTRDASVKGVDDNRRGRDLAKLFPDRRNQGGMVFNQCQRRRHKVEWNVPRNFDHLTLPKGLDAGKETFGPFECAVDY